MPQQLVGRAPVLILALAAMLGLQACATTKGAVAGAGIGAVAGDAKKGAAAGAAAGAVVDIVD